MKNYTRVLDCFLVDESIESAANYLRNVDINMCREGAYFALFHLGRVVFVAGQRFPADLERVKY